MNGAVKSDQAIRDPASPPRRSLPVRLLKAVGWLAINLVVAFVLLEVIVRATDPMGISYYPETARLMEDVLQLEEPIGYRLKPGVEGTFHGASVRVNTLGLRGPEIAERPAEGEFRILVLGDSVVFGIGVNAEDSIPGQLEAVANRSQAGARRYVAVNMGVPSYNTEQELLQFSDVGLRLRPSLVILMFDSNDIEPRMWVFQRRASGVANLGQRSYALSLLFAVRRMVSERVTGTSSRIAYTAYEPDHPRWLAIDDSMTRINQLSRQAGIPFVVFEREEHDSASQRLLRGLAKREGFAMISLRALFEPYRDARDPLKYQNSAIDGHFNKAGSELIARLMYQQLVALGALR